MKALVVKQPWASMIAAGVKKIENRTWKTHYRGPLAIIAGRSRSEMGDYVGPSLPFGSAVAVVEIVDCVPLDRCEGEDHAEGPWCWILGSPVELDRPIPVLGKMGLFDLPDDFDRELSGEPRVER